MWAKHEQPKIQMVERIAQVQVLTTAFIDGRDISFLKYIYIYIL